jgi:EAL domain-containing protein (putative c-di-GMP-specific phosphodiesterase class I)
VAAAANYAAKVVSSAEAFRRETEERWPAVLLLDLQMPDTDGIELLREIGERRCTSKIILVSGMDGRVLESARRLGQELGLAMAGKVPKPVRAAELRQLLATLREDVDAPPTAEALAAAVDDDRLFLLYQPKIDIRSGQMTGVEALVRWKSDTGRVIPPTAFIPVAEASGLIDRLTSWVVSSAFRQAGAWRQKGVELHVAVNLSAGNVHDRQLPDRLAALCATENLPPSAVTLEITETTSAHDHTTLLEVLGRFRLKGFHLSIDDFGTGYSSVAQLLRLPFSELKVDKSFISEIGYSRDAEIVAKTVIDMAHNLGLSAVAEGVEAEPVLRTLLGWNCDVAQGYLFSRPVSPAAIEAMAAASPWQR